VKAFVTSYLLFVATAVHGAESQPSPYVGQEHRAIMSLSSAEINDLLAGKGMGLAKAAELNGYPGPKHVLELAPQLNLTPDQLASTKSLHSSMRTKASALGRRIIEREQTLDRMFADKTIAEASLSDALAEIGDLQAQLRQAHLEAHLVQARILTDAQSAQYAKLRGYSDQANAAEHRHVH
jgi:Spy/CpxP family protein refolding chaperone